MQRREFISLIGSVAATWPLAALAQPGEQMRRIGVLMNRSESDPEGQARLAAFKQALEQLGWNGGRNIRIGARARRDPCERHHKRDGVASSQPYATHRVRGGRRSGRCRLRRVHGTPGR